MSKTMFLPNYTIGEDAYENIYDICSKYGKKIVFIGGKTAIQKAELLIKEAISNTNLEVIDTIWYGGEASYENVEILKNNKSVQEADMIFAIGGGKACDTCKVLSEKIKKPIFTFPTISSTCASITSVCAMYSQEGVYKDVFFKLAPANHIFINTKIIAEAPEKYLWAGIGDTLAKGYEPEFSSRNMNLDYSNMLGVTLSKLCQEPLVKYGAQAMTDCKDNKVSFALEETILTIIVTTGLVSNSLIMDYNSCIAHAICYGFSSIKKVEENHLHGELVSYGVLVQLAVDNNFKEIDKLLPFYNKINLPVTYKAFNVNCEDIEKILDKASSVGDIKKAAFPITREILKKGIYDLENYIN